MGMKAATIKLVIRDRLAKWSDSITDDAVKALVKRDTIVSGGCIASMLMGDKVNDYDLYFRTKETALAVAEYYVKVFNETKGTLATKAASSCNPTVKEEKRVNIKGNEEDRIIIYMKSSGVASETQDAAYQYFENAAQDGPEEDFFASVQGYETSMEGAMTENPLTVGEQVKEELRNAKKAAYRPVFLSDNAITLSDKVQLVVRFYGNPAEIHENYDFAHAMCYYDWHSDNLVLPADALESMMSKSLIYKGSLYPLCSMFRVRKFIARGWRISAGQMLKIIFQIGDVDLTDPKVLREQLIGVDMAYMFELIRTIEKETGRIDQTYLAKLIDTVFDE